MRSDVDEPRSLSRMLAVSSRPHRDGWRSPSATYKSPLATIISAEDRLTSLLPQRSSFGYDTVARSPSPFTVDPRCLQEARKGPRSIILLIPEHIARYASDIGGTVPLGGIIVKWRKVGIGVWLEKASHAFGQVREC